MDRERRVRIPGIRIGSSFALMGRARSKTTAIQICTYSQAGKATDCNSGIVGSSPTMCLNIAGQLVPASWRSSPVNRESGKNFKDVNSNSIFQGTFNWLERLSQRNFLSKTPEGCWFESSPRSTDDILIDMKRATSKN